MRLTDLEVSGFKSFAASTHLHFDKGLTAVIGPNGSGKSNLSEAIRWVLGEQSAKQLRAQVARDVIFSGTDRAAASRKALVTLTFENEDGRFPIEAAEVQIGRTLTRDGESEYTLNGEPVRLIDLQQYLAEAGIGARTYTVISQGMVDRYLQATPLMRRELFDEATGIKALQIKISQAKRRLDKTDEQASELHAVIRELAPRVTSLRKQAERFHERRTLEVEFDASQAAWFHHEWSTRSQRVDLLHDKLSGLSSAIDEAREARESIEDIALKGDAAATSVEQKLELAEESFAQAMAAYESSMKEKQNLERSIATVSDELAQAQKDLDEAKKNSPQAQWMGKVRDVLVACERFLQQSMSSNEVDRDQADKLIQDISSTHELVDENASVDAARQVLESLEGPLSAVARLSAVLEERQARLASLSLAPAPDPTEVERLRAQISGEGEHVGIEGEGDIRDQMRAAREEEVAKEREHSATETTYDQARSDLEQLKSEILRERGSDFLEAIMQEAPTADRVEEEVVRTIAARLAAIGEIDELVLKEFEEASGRLTRLESQLGDIEAASANIQKLIKQLTQDMDQNFEKQFKVISAAFETYFKQLFNGGVARLELIPLTQEEDDAESSASTYGIEITASPPGKKTKNISLLSGGERALTSLALLMAILDAQKPPFIVLDEVDAALDEANSRRFAELMRSKSKTTQCIVISHNRETMAQANVLYGVTMQKEGISKVYAVTLEEVADEDRPSMPI